MGSILGPILYLLYTADILQSKLIVTSTFADDTAILWSHLNPGVAFHLPNNHLGAVETCHWKLVTSRRGDE